MFLVRVVIREINIDLLWVEKESASSPFGICKRIEVISAGGKKTKNGYQIAHFYLDYDKIVSDSDKTIKLDRGPNDRKFREKPGTTIRLSRFLPKRVPDVETFHRQLASRFIFADPKFRIVVEDLRAADTKPPTEVSPLNVDTVPGTRIDLSKRPVEAEDGSFDPDPWWRGSLTGKGGPTYLTNK